MVFKDARSRARERFRTLIRLPDAQIPLAEAALCIAWEDQGGGNIGAAMQQIAAIAAELRPRVADLDDPHRILGHLNAHLFETLGFCGNARRYNVPENSFLDRVLETHMGLPITLSVLYLAVAWRLRLPMSGVALPGHFLVRYHAADEEIFVDPFNKGRLWSRDECERQVLLVLRKATAQDIQAALEPPTRRQILARLLRNLKNVYVSQSDLSRALAASERIMLLLPDDAPELRDRGLLRAQLSQLHAAVEDLERYAALAPDASDLPDVRRYASTLIERLAYGN